MRDQIVWELVDQIRAGYLLYSNVHRVKDFKENNILKTSSGYKSVQNKTLFHL